METHTLDQLDRQLLHALEIDGRAPFSRIADVIGVSDQTVARRFRRLTSAMEIRVVAVRDGERLGHESWLLRMRCAPDGAERLAHALARRPDTAWIALVSGPTEVVCTIRAGSQSEQEELLLGRLPRTPGVLEIKAHKLLHRFYGGSEGLVGKSGALTAEQVARLRAAGPDTAPEGSGRAVLTPEDEPLVAALERDGRATYAELRQATGRPESYVRRRLGRLLRSGAIYIDMQFERGGFDDGVRAILWITAAPAALDSVGRAIATHREVAFVSATAGASNLLAVVVCRDTASVYRYLSEGVGKLDGVQHVECGPVLRTFKQLAYEEPRRPGPRAARA